MKRSRNENVNSGPSNADKGPVNNDGQDEFVFIENEEDSVEGNDLSAQIARALKNFAPYFTREIKSTMEEAVNGEIATMIREEVSLAVQEEFTRRYPEGQLRNENIPRNTYTYKNFSVCKPPEYSGDIPTR